MKAHIWREVEALHEWIKPGVYKAANADVLVKHDCFIAFLKGIRDDGKWFYVRLTAPPTATDYELSEVERLGRVRLDAYLEVDS